MIKTTSRKRGWSFLYGFEGVHRLSKIVNRIIGEVKKEPDKLIDLPRIHETLVTIS